MTDWKNPTPRATVESGWVSATPEKGQSCDRCEKDFKRVDVIEASYRLAADTNEVVQVNGRRHVIDCTPKAAPVARPVITRQYAGHRCYKCGRYAEYNSSNGPACINHEDGEY